MFFNEIFSREFEFKELVNQYYRIGNNLLLLIYPTDFVTGFVFTK
jgi:hypothetical protein